MLKGKNVLITGSSSGIGLATARLAKEYGANVIVHGKEESGELDAIAKELGAEKIICDVGDREAVFSEINKLREKNIKIDCLANVAGIGDSGASFMDTKDNDWLDVFRINLLGVVHMCQAIIPLMQEKKYGRIVNVSSIRAHPQGTHGARAPYAASKAGLLNLTVVLAKEFAKDGITANSISPGGVNTNMAKQWSEAARKKNSDVLLGRIAEPKEIAEAICFFLSDRASYATGQDYVFDGGYLIGK